MCSRRRWTVEIFCPSYRDHNRPLRSAPPDSSDTFNNLDKAKEEHLIKP